METTMTRPSDEDIISFENQIREEQVNVHPLISIPLPLSILEEEYTGSANGHFLPKIKQLEQDFRAMRKTRGDGNCFFRAFAFGLVERVGERPKEAQSILIAQLASRVTDILKSAGFEKLAYEDFYDEFVAMMREAAAQHDRGAEWMAEEWQTYPHRSHSLVVLLRLVASAYLRTHAELYEPFIWEMATGISQEGQNASNMVQFCQRFVECLGVESDQIHIIALTKALSCTVEIAYIDGGDMPLSTLRFGPDASEEGGGEEAISPPILIHLLYRPGHYDLLYKK